MHPISHSFNLNHLSQNAFTSWMQQNQNTLLIVIYSINLVTLIVGSIALFFTSKAPKLLFDNIYFENGSMKLLGAFWISIGVLSIFGIYNPIKFSPVLIIQVIYKGLYLLVQLIPRLINKQTIPIALSIFFVAWVVILPFVIPWNYLFEK